MNLGMGPGLELRQELNLRQELEERLDLSITPKIELNLYLEHEDFITYLIKWTNRHNRWRNFEKLGFNFVYGDVPYKIAKPVADVYGPGFSHCIYNPTEGLFNPKGALVKGSWVLFVVEDKVPKNLQSMIALHERGEEISAGDHYFATKLEFGAAGKLNKVRSYSRWIDNKFPKKFVDAMEKVYFPVLPDELREYLEENSSGKHKDLELAERLIEEHPIPSTVIKKALDYDDRNNLLVNTLNELGGTFQNLVANSENVYQAADKLDDALRRIFSVLERKTLDILAPRKLNPEFEGLNKLVSDAVNGLRQTKIGAVKPTEYIEVPFDIYDAICRFRKRKPIVRVLDAANKPNIGNSKKEYSGFTLAND